MGWDCGDRLIPVLDFHRVERNVDDVAVGMSLGHFDPVPDPDHIVGHDLNASHQRQDRVPEHQHQHGRKRPEA